MAELLTYGVVGFHHIADLAAADHILFLLALGAGYRLTQYRPALWVVSAFTLGHSITLGLAVTGMVSFPAALIEFLIPVTILLTCLENLRHRGGSSAATPVHGRAMLALTFGLVHGAGFANYLNSMFVTPITLPLLGFNLGIEAGQILILFLSGAVFALVDRGLRRVAIPAMPAYQLRMLGVSAIVAVLAGRMVVERSAW